MDIKAYRQGEILFIPVEKQSEERVNRLHPTPDNVIREGEVSGHKHEVIGEGELKEYNKWMLSGYSVGDNALPDGDMFLTAKDEIKIVHPEHKTLSLPKGDYVIRIQREYDEERARRVLD